MKFRLIFKTPDVTDQFSKEELENEDLRELLMRFIHGGEYVRIEFDTDNKTATVVDKK